MLGEKVEKGFYRQAAMAGGAAMGISLAASLLLAVTSYLMFSMRTEGVWGLIVAFNFLALGYIATAAGYSSGWLGYSLRPTRTAAMVALNGPTIAEERSWLLIKTTVASLALAAVYLYTAIDGDSPLPSWYIPGIIAMVAFLFSYSGLKAARKSYFLDGVLSEKEREEAVSWESKLKRDDESWGRRYLRTSLARVAPRLLGHDRSTILLSPLVSVSGFLTYSIFAAVVWVNFPVGSPAAAAARNGAMVFVAALTCWLIAYVARWVAHRRRYSEGATLMEPVQLR